MSTGRHVVAVEILVFRFTGAGGSIISGLVTGEKSMSNQTVVKRSLLKNPRNDIARDGNENEVTEKEEKERGHKVLKGTCYLRSLLF